MSYTDADYASAVWAYTPRTLVSGTPASPTTPAQVWAQAIWEDSPRTLTATIYPNFVDALTAVLMADPQIQSGYPPAANSEYAASVSNNAADRDAPVPLLAFHVAEVKPFVRVIGFGGRRIEYVTVAFHSVGPAAVAEQLGTMLKSRLLPAWDGSYVPPPLLFADGVDTGRFVAEGGSTYLDPERSYLNQDVYVNVVPITWIVARG